MYDTLVYILLLALLSRPLDSYLYTSVIDGVCISAVASSLSNPLNDKNDVVYVLLVLYFKEKMPGVAIKRLIFIIRSL